MEEKERKNEEEERVDTSSHASGKHLRVLSETMRGGAAKHRNFEFTIQSS